MVSHQFVPSRKALNTVFSTFPCVTVSWSWNQLLVSNGFPLLIPFKFTAFSFMWEFLTEVCGSRWLTRNNDNAIPSNSTYSRAYAIVHLSATLTSRVTQSVLKLANLAHYMGTTFLIMVPVEINYNMGHCIYLLKSHWNVSTTFL